MPSFGLSSPGPTQMNRWQQPPNQFYRPPNPQLGSAQQSPWNTGGPRPTAQFPMPQRAPGQEQIFKPGVTPGIVPIFAPPRNQDTGFQVGGNMTPAPTRDSSAGNMGYTTGLQPMVAFNDYAQDSPAMGNAGNMGYTTGFQPMPLFNDSAPDSPRVARNDMGTTGYTTGMVGGLDRRVQGTGGMMVGGNMLGSISPMADQGTRTATGLGMTTGYQPMAMVQDSAAPGPSAPTRDFLQQQYNTDLSGYGADDPERPSFEDWATNNGYGDLSQYASTPAVPSPASTGPQASAPAPSTLSPEQQARNQQYEQWIRAGAIGEPPPSPAMVAQQQQQQTAAASALQQVAGLPSYLQGAFDPTGAGPAAQTPAPAAQPQAASGGVQSFNPPVTPYATSAPEITPGANTSAWGPAQDANYQSQLTTWLNGGSVGPAPAYGGPTSADNHPAASQTTTMDIPGLNVSALQASYNQQSPFFAPGWNPSFNDWASNLGYNVGANGAVSSTSTLQQGAGGLPASHNYLNGVTMPAPATGPQTGPGYIGTFDPGTGAPSTGTPQTGAPGGAVGAPATGAQTLPPLTNPGAIPTNPTGGPAGPNYGGIGRDMGSELAALTAYQNPLATNAYNIAQQFNPLYTGLNMANYGTALGIAPYLNAANQAANPWMEQNNAMLNATREFQNQNGAPQWLNANTYSAATASPTLAPQAAQSQMAGGFNPITGMSVNPNTGFTPIQSAANDAGLQAAQNRLGSLGNSPLQQMLQQQAQQQLALGSGLSQEDVRNAQQAAREGWGARGLINSNGAVAEEALNRYNLGQQRLQERMGMAQSVDQNAFQQGLSGLQGALGLSDASRGYAGLGLQAQQSNLGAQLSGNQLGLQGQMANQQNAYQTALANLNGGLNYAQMGTQNNQFNANMANQLGMYNAGLGSQFGLANQAAQNQAAQFGASATNTLNPFNVQQAMNFGQQGFQNALSQAQLQQQQAINPFQIAGALTGQTPDYTTNLLGYGGDLFNTNYNAATAARMGATNNSAATSGALIGAAGKIGSAALASTASQWGPWLASLLAACWTAREVYGENNPRWKIFRSWMLNKAPDWFRELYLEHGEAFAEFIKDKPTLKDAIRAWMDARVREYVQGKPTAPEAFDFTALKEAA